MLHGGMAGNQVQQHMDAPLVGLGEQLLQILVGAVAGRCSIIIRYIIARVSEGRQEAGIDPQSVESQFFDVIQFADDAPEISDSVGVGIQEGLGINLIKNGIVQPLGHKGGSFHFFYLDNTTSHTQSQERFRYRRAKNKDGAIRPCCRFNGQTDFDTGWRRSRAFVKAPRACPALQYAHPA